MIRLFKLIGAHTAIILLWVRYVALVRGENLDTMLSLRERVDQMTPEHRALFDRVVEIGIAEQRGNNRAEPSMEEVLDAVLESVTADPPPDLSLIDRMAELLKLPFGVNLLKQQTITTMRKALFSNAEYESLASKLETVELACSGCGHNFVNGEGAYFSGGGRSCQLQCFRCAPPVYSACCSCREGYAGVSGNVRTSLQAKSVCEDCRIKKAEAARAAAQGAQQRAEIRANPLHAADQLVGAMVANDFQAFIRDMGQGGAAFDIEAPRRNGLIENIGAVWDENAPQPGDPIGAVDLANHLRGRR